MLTKDFLVFLEYEISEALGNSEDKNTRRCWCDGVILPENEEEYSIKRVNDKRKVVTGAWIDEGRVKGKEIGQYIYQLTIHFGRKSISNYVKGKELIKCVPSAETDEWIYLDTEEKIIEIRLL
jgi:hypothetical protein